jgi:tRNA A58 N-methylase Trm61
MYKPMSNISFSFMSFYFRFRDYFYPPTRILKQAGIQRGSTILDFGAESGSYSIPAAQLVGPTGKVFAADIHSRAINEIRSSLKVYIATLDSFY